MQMAENWLHPNNPFVEPAMISELRQKYGRSWTRVRSVRVDEPTAIQARVSSPNARCVVAWDGEAIAYGPFAGEAIIPLDMVRGRDLDFYLDDAGQTVELSATSYDPTKLRNLTTVTQAEADNAIKAVQYKRGQLVSLHFAKGGSEDYQTGALANFAKVLDMWLADYAPEWYDAKEYDKIVSTAKGIVANVDSTLRQDDENLFAFADDMKRGVEEAIDKAGSKASGLVTLLVVGLVALAISNVVKAIP
jgi:hypothetical protein